MLPEVERPQGGNITNVESSTPIMLFSLKVRNQWALGGGGRFNDNEKH